MKKFVCLFRGSKKALTIKLRFKVFCGTAATDFIVSDNYEEKEKLQLWNKSFKATSFTIFNEDNKDFKKRWKNENILNATNKSTLSLRITAYKNLTTSDFFDDRNTERLKKGKFGTIKASKQCFTDSLKSQNPFEFPRQQNGDQRNKSEVMQFKASQQLIGSNRSSSAMNIGSRTPLVDSGTMAHATTSLSLGSSAKANCVIDEMKTTEESYVRELKEIIEYYIKPFDAPENSSHYPLQLRGQSKRIFGNIHALYKFHERLSRLFNSTNSIAKICHLLVFHRYEFLILYRPYFQNKRASEAIQTEYNIDKMKFFVNCQYRAGHLLPLSSYLLKPIQRVTKYQLMLKELLKFSSYDIEKDVKVALAAMLDLLSQLNAGLQKLHISAFPGDLHRLGSLHFQDECLVYFFRRKNHRLSNKPKERILFLFESAVLFCKKQPQPLSYAEEFCKYKMSIPMKDLGFSESLKTPERFEIWDATKNEGYAIQPIDKGAKAQWIKLLFELTTALGHYHNRSDLQQTFGSSNRSSFLTSSSSSRPQSWKSDGTASSCAPSEYDDMLSASTSSNIQSIDL